MSAAPLASGVYLEDALAPLQLFLGRSDITDIHINRPGEVWLESTLGAIERHDVEALTEIVLDRLVTQVAALTHQGVNREHPLLAAALPDGARIQAVIPPATREHLAISIRKHRATTMRLTDYEADGAFAPLSASSANDENIDKSLRELRDQRRFTELLSMAVRNRRNILVSGGTSTGKTTFLNALLREVDIAERLILIEDTPELATEHPNAVSLLAARSVLGEADVTTDDLVAASLRMRPDRIIIGELRGREALAYLRAVNTGHPGSMTTVHADGPARAIDQIVLLVLQAGTTLTRDDIAHYVRSTVDVYVHLDRVGGHRLISAIALKELS